MEACNNFNLSKLGEGDGYCPGLLANDVIKKTAQHSFRTTASGSISTTTSFKNSGPGLLTAKKLTSDEMGRELIFKISRDEFIEFETLLNNGANPNFFDENTGNTPLHFLYYYGNCEVQYLESLLKYDAKVVLNHDGLSPLQIAEKNCNATQMLKIQEFFARKDHQDKLSITIAIPVASFVNGAISGLSIEIAQ